MENVTNVNSVLDRLVFGLNSIFKECLLGLSCLKHSEDTLLTRSNVSYVSTTIEENTITEPIPLSDIIGYAQALPTFLTEAYHGKIVQLWQDCIDAIFSYFVDLHFSGIRTFCELKRRQVQIDFKANKDILTQVKEKLKSDFEFQKYPERITGQVFWKILKETGRGCSKTTTVK